MKTRKLNKKLVLNKKTVSDLSKARMNQVKGRENTVATFSMYVRCFVCESDGDPCETAFSVCECNYDTGDDGDDQSVPFIESLCIRCPWAV